MEARQVAGVAVVSCHLGCFSHRDLINWKENGAEGDRKATDSLGQKGGSYCIAESRGGSFRWTEGKKARRSRNDVSFKGS